MSSTPMDKITAGAQERALRKRDRLDRITEINAIQSPLLRLPAEIRNTIYTYVFCNEKYDICHREWGFPGIRPVRPQSPAPWGDVQEFPGMALLLASRQIHHETALFPYKLLVFYCGILLRDNHGITSRKLTVIADFLGERTKAQAKALRKMQVDEVRYDMVEFHNKTRMGDAAYWAAEMGCSDFLS